MTRPKLRIVLTEGTYCRYVRAAHGLLPPLSIPVIVDRVRVEKRGIKVIVAPLDPSVKLEHTRFHKQDGKWVPVKPGTCHTQILSERKFHANEIAKRLFDLRHQYPDPYQLGILELEAAEPHLDNLVQAIEDPDKHDDFIQGILETLAHYPVFRGKTPAEEGAVDKLHREHYVEHDPASGWILTHKGRQATGRTLEGPERERFEQEVNGLLHASRDSLRRKGEDTTIVRFLANDSFYGEAFGMFRALENMGLGEWGDIHDEKTLNYWFHQIQREVLAEENFDGTNKCDFCLAMYGYDGQRTSTVDRDRLVNYPLRKVRYHQV